MVQHANPIIITWTPPGPVFTRKVCNHLWNFKSHHRVVDAADMPSYLWSKTRQPWSSPQSPSRLRGTFLQGRLWRCRPSGRAPPSSAPPCSTHRLSWCLRCSTEETEALEPSGSHLMMEWSGPRVTTVASVAWRDISLAKAWEVFLWCLKHGSGQWAEHCDRLELFVVTGRILLMSHHHYLREIHLDSWWSHDCYYLTTWPDATPDDQI